MLDVSLIATIGEIVFFFTYAAAFFFSPRTAWTVVAGILATAALVAAVFLTWGLVA